MVVAMGGESGFWVPHQRSQSHRRANLRDGPRSPIRPGSLYYNCRKLRGDFRVVVGRVTSECHAPLFCIGDGCAQRHRGNARKNCIEFNNFLLILCRIKLCGTDLPSVPSKSAFPLAVFRPTCWWPVANQSPLTPVAGPITGKPSGRVGLLSTATCHTSKLNAPHMRAHVT